MGFIWYVKTTCGTAMFTPGPSVTVRAAPGAPNLIARKLDNETIVVVLANGLEHAAIDLNAS